jgi:hypothetical protein
MAKEVVITASVIPPDGAAPSPADCRVPVDPVSGAWSSAAMKTPTELYCPDAAKGRLVVDEDHPLKVASSERGETSVRGFIPTQPRALVGAEQVAQTLKEITGPGLLRAEDKELIQFKGERTPQAVIRRIAPPRATNVNVPQAPPPDLQHEHEHGADDEEMRHN